MSHKKTFKAPIGIFAGTLRKDKTYVTYRNKDHFFRKFEGFGISTKLLMELRRQGCRKIIIVYDIGEKQILYEVHPDTFLSTGIIWKFRQADYQRVLSLIYFTKVS